MELEKTRCIYCQAPDLPSTIRGTCGLQEAGQRQQKKKKGGGLPHHIAYNAEGNTKSPEMYSAYHLASAPLYFKDDRLSKDFSLSFR